jgi:hypothetical protein
MTHTPDTLAALDTDGLTEWLVGAARELRNAVAERNDAAVAETLRLVRNAGMRASGPTVALLDVAEAFLKLLGRGNDDPRAMAVHRFLASDSIKASRVLDRLLQREALASTDLAGLPAAVAEGIQSLVDVGVLKVTTRGHVIVPQAFSVVTDVFDPLAFRHWRRVDQARSSAMGLNAEDRSTYLASALAVTPQQAQRFLQQSPLPVPHRADEASPIFQKRRRAPAQDLSAAKPLSITQPGGPVVSFTNTSVQNITPPIH